jgi:serine/threonine protein kinase
VTLLSAAPAALVPGYTLDRYELLCPIAEGGMASVWIARLHGKLGFEKLVALKTILPKYAADAAFQEMLLDEARVASRIHHLNVAQILDLGEEQGILYLVAEWIDGDSLFKLHHLVARKGLSFPSGILLRILADTCAGLHVAHELCDENDNPLGVVHRDVSPENILVSAQGIAKLIDFGIAKARNRFARDTRSGIVKGTLPYMAPEQARGLRLDRRADIWAIGTILYWLLSGKAPYDGGSPMETLGLVASGRRPAPLPATVHPAIRAVISKALSPQLDARFATAADLRDEIEGAMTAASATATTSDVAAFIGKHMGDRAAARKHAIDLAIKAAGKWHSSQRAPGQLRASSSSLAATRSDAQTAPSTSWAALGEPRATAQPTTTDVAAFLRDRPDKHELVQMDDTDLASEPTARLRSSQRELNQPSPNSNSLVATRPDRAMPAPVHEAPVSESGATTPPDLSRASPPAQPVVPRRIALPRTRRGWVLLGLALCVAGVAVLRASGAGRAVEFGRAVASPMPSGSETMAASRAAPAMAPRPRDMPSTEK